MCASIACHQGRFAVTGGAVTPRLRSVIVDPIPRSFGGTNYIGKHIPFFNFVEVKVGDNSLLYV